MPHSLSVEKLKALFYISLPLSLIAIIISISQSLEESHKFEQESSDFSSEAKAASRNYVRMQLSSPDSANFVALDTERLANGNYKTIGTVDAKNPYGVKIRHQFYIVQQKADNSWNTLEFAFY
ncbi:hypothetical protein [Rubellicoccus peritrichatus]|uniref:Uncharacterized protein n=1 Tax=Rubellicoccus peritrichatus TaxID=3080537 RepID=A0AAQ3QSH9_9BACT|nr:hypothetical protein [Puniceicoccus sp. CR14]WOO40366.1 hypothetical protein RZN69_17240 [Puniceicoccus sp. CR14]WOO40415.1 hypothetical protein RZN69_17485 [Puniceicoccus sp. CR14]WOO40464.1 hypothetical protein RZN69_17730 [Puniceicoccus sp. CR14]WOO40513.1 hypothetical protein RZN69_17975 [Puniceicoccus sp. CR14]